MPRFKAFNSAMCDDDTEKMEQLINVWMKSEKPRITHATQSAFGAHFVVGFVYEVADPTEALRKEAVAEADWYSLTDLEYSSINGKTELPAEVDLPY